MKKRVRTRKVSAQPLLLVALLLAFAITSIIAYGQADPTGTIAGTVTDVSTGAPIQGALVTATPTSQQGQPSGTTTAADGTYSIGGLIPANYDVTASKAGYDPQTVNNQPILPFQTTIVNFQLTPTGGQWSQGTGNIIGTVRNTTNDRVGGATVRVLGTSFSDTTTPAGTYTINSVPSGTYDISASKPADGYDDATALNVDVVSGTVTVDFTLLLSLGGCTNECTKAGSNTCDASCDGKGSCKFYSDETKQACDGTFGIVGLSGGRQVGCCEGRPYTLQKADVTVQAKEIIKTVKPVVYQGKLVNMVTLLFIPERQP